MILNIKAGFDLPNIPAYLNKLYKLPQKSNKVLVPLQNQMLDSVQESICNFEFLKKRISKYCMPTISIFSYYFS